MNNYTIYQHTTPNNKIYIGITSMIAKKRWNNGLGYRHNIYFYNAIQKYGWDNIKHEILFSDLTKEEAEQKEIELIAFYKSNQKEYGYNIENGGNGAGKLTQAQKEHLRIINKNRKLTQKQLDALAYGRALAMSEEEKRKIGLANKGRSPWNKGKRLSQDSIDKMIKGRAEYNKTHCKKVICIETGVVYSSSSEAGRQTGLSQSKISNCCCGTRKTTGGYHWAFYNKGI